MKVSAVLQLPLTTFVARMSLISANELLPTGTFSGTVVSTGGNQDYVTVSTVEGGGVRHHNHDFYCSDSVAGRKTRISDQPRLWKLFR